MALTKVRGAGAEGLTLSSTALTIANGLTLTDGDVTLASGHGLNFAATSDASGQSSELLDDYEEGTWTPNPEGSSTAGTYNNNYRVGRYVKIGTMVYISGVIYGTLSGHGGFAHVTGLPYSKVNEDTPTLSVQWNNMPFESLGEQDHQTIGLISGSHIFFRANDRRINEAYAGIDWGGGSPQTISYLRFSGSYRNT